MGSYIKEDVKVADELFLIVALLEREHPDRPGFSVKEILERATLENITGELRSGLSIHAYEHAVANLKPGSGKYRILYKTQQGKLRLLRAGDDVHPGRTGKIWPNLEDVPQKYAELIEWAKRRYSKGGSNQRSGSNPLNNSNQPRWLEGIFQMRGLGKKLWAEEDADEYVSKLRENW